MQVVGVLVHHGVGAVHERRNLDELLDPLVNEAKNGIIITVGALELKVEAEFEVLNVDVDEEERRFGLFLTGSSWLEIIMQNL